MVLEETLIICGQFDLPEVTRAFREADIQVRTTQTIALESLVSAKGAIKDIRTLLEDEIERIEGFTDEDFTDEDFTDEIDEDEDTESGDLYDSYLDVVDRVAEIITDFMEKHQPGDALSLIDIKEWMSLPAETALEGEMSEDLLFDIESSMLYRYMAFIALNENGLINAEGEEVIVQKHMEPEDVVLSLPVIVIEDIDPESLKEYGVLTEMTVITVPELRLEFGPEVVVEMDLGDVDDIIDDLGIDEDVYASFREAVSLKQVVVARTMEILEERGTLALEEIVEAFGSSTMGDAEEGWSIVLDLTPEFVKRLLNDLKKIGMVRKRGSGFRVV